MKLVFGIIILVFTVISIWVCVARTPDHLQGWYGKMYGIIALGGFIGGICLILSHFGVI